MILWMMFWNMKYLSLLLLLCCACCKVAIQAFVQEDRQKIQKKTCKSLTQHRQLDRRHRIAKNLQHFTTFTDGHNHRHGYRRHHQRMAHIPIRAIVRLRLSDCLVGRHNYRRNHQRIWKIQCACALTHSY